MSAADSCFGTAAGELIATKAATMTIKKTNVSFFAMFTSSRSTEHSIEGNAGNAVIPVTLRREAFQESIKT